MEEPQRDSVLEDIDTPSVPNELDDDTPFLSLITVLIVVIGLCVGGYILYWNFSKTHNVPAAINTLRNTINQNSAPQN